MWGQFRVEHYGLSSRNYGNYDMAERSMIPVMIAAVGHLFPLMWLCTPEKHKEAHSKVFTDADLYYYD